MSPTVSVIVPNYNGGELFRRCVRSLAELEYPAERLAVFVVDDGSTDGSAEWLRSEPLPGFLHPVLRTVNCGRARARNVGLQQAVGEIVVFLDGDLTVEPDFVAQHVRVHEREAVSAVLGRRTAHPSVPLDRVSRYLHHFPGRGARQFGEGRPVPPEFVLTCNLSIRRRLLEEIGGFDESFVGYGGEDTLLGYRIEERHPGGIRYADGPVAYDYDRPPLAELLRKFGHYGRHNLGRLVELYPDASERLHADWVLGSPAKRGTGRVLFSSPVYWLVRGAAPFVPPPWSDYAIRYLVGASVVRGFRDGRRRAA